MTDHPPLFSSALLDRANFATTTFAAHGFVDGVVSKSLETGLAPLKSKRFGLDPIQPLTSDEARKIAQETVDALSDALEEVSRLRIAESEARDKCVKICANVEADEKSKLAKIRGKADIAAAQLRDLEGQLTSAASLTAGIEQLLELAAAKSSRGKTVLELNSYFRELIRIPRAEMHEHFEQLSHSRQEARGRVRAAWKTSLRIGRDAPVVPENFFTLPEANAGAVVTQERLVAQAGIPLEICSRALMPSGIELIKKLAQLCQGLEGRMQNVENVQMIADWTADELIKDLQSLLEAFYELYEAFSPTLPVAATSTLRLDAITADAGPQVATPQIKPATPPSKPVTPPTAPAEPAAAVPPDAGDTAAAGRGRGRAGRGRALGRTRRGAAAADGPALDAPAAAAPEAAPAPTTRLGAKSRRNQASAIEAGPIATPQVDPNSAGALAAQDLTSPYARQILASLDLIARLYTHLTGGTEALQKYYVDQTIAALRADVDRLFEYDKLPNLPAPEEPYERAMSRATQSALDRKTGDMIKCIKMRLQRESLVSDSIFRGNTQVIHDLCNGTLKTVLRGFIVKAQAQSGHYREDALRQDATLSSAQQKRNVYRVLDREYYHISLYATMFKHVQAFAEQLPGCGVHPSLIANAHVGSQHAIRNGEAGGEPSSPMRRGAPSTFAGNGEGELSYVIIAEQLFEQRVAYGDSNFELEKFGVHCHFLESTYHKALLTPSDGICDVTEAHAQKYLEAVELANFAGERIVTLAPTPRHAPLTRGIAAALAKFILTFVQEELTKALNALKYDMSYWSRKPPMPNLRDPPLPPGQVSFPTREVHHGAARIVLWAQQALGALLRFVEQHMAPQYAKEPSLQVEMDSAITNELQPLNDMATQVITLVCHAVVVKSLAYLLHYQKKDEYKLSKTDAVAAAESSTRAAGEMAKYLKFQLNEIRELISTFASPEENNASSDSSRGGGAGVRGADGVTPHGDVSTKNLNSQRAALGVAATPRAGDNVVAEVSAAETAAAALSTVTTGAGSSAFGGMSVGRLIATGLYRGITAHFRGLVVNDEGALLFKRDVALYRDAVQPLLANSRSALEKKAISLQFDMIREVANLMLMPFDNIQQLRSNGLLRFLHKKEVSAYLRMRSDLRQQLRMAENMDSDW